MILFTILALTAIFLIVFGIVMVSAFGAGVLIVFGDVIICIVLIIYIIKKILERKRNRK